MGSVGPASAGVGVGGKGEGTDTVNAPLALTREVEAIAGAVVVITPKALNRSSWKKRTMSSHSTPVLGEVPASTATWGTIEMCNVPLSTAK